MYRLEKKSLYMRWCWMFGGSFLLGIFLMNFANEILLTEEGIFSISVMNRLKYMEIDGGSFLGYVLQKRFGSCMVLILLSMTGIGTALLYGFVCWQGLLAGMTVTAAMIRFGIKGMLLIMGAAFPHQLLIVPAGIMLLVWCFENRGHLYFRKRDRALLLRQAITLIWIGIVIFISCILESYVNPILLLDIIKIF